MISRWVLPTSLSYPWYDITLGIVYKAQLPVVWYHAGYSLQVSDTRGMISRWVLPTSLSYPWYDITLGIVYKAQLPVVWYHAGYRLQVSAARSMILRWVMPTSLRYPWYDITLGIVAKTQRSQLAYPWCDTTLGIAGYSRQHRAVSVTRMHIQYMAASRKRPKRKTIARFFISSHKRFKRTLFIRTKYNLQIFGVIPFSKLQNDT